LNSNTGGGRGCGETGLDGDDLGWICGDAGGPSKLEDEVGFGRGRPSGGAALGSGCSDLDDVGNS
jgi:hypothetical protein